MLDRARAREVAETAALVAARGRARDPASWGRMDGQLDLATSHDIVAPRGGKSRERPAVRQDFFRHLFSCDAITASQYDASKRYFKDRCLQMGVKESDTLRLVFVSGGGSSDGISQGMIDAGKRVAAVEARIGRLNVRVIRSLIEPMLRGEVRVWRVLVAHETGESERHAQAGAVRLALENLRLEYEAIDAEAHRARRAARSVPISARAGHQLVTTW